MDDVYVVVGLLLFGSLLFCLCCYKVSNLLYMLYHIDDTEAEDELTPEFAKEVLNNAAASGQYSSLLSTYADGGPKGGNPVGQAVSVGEGLNNESNAKLMQLSEFTSASAEHLGNHIGGGGYPNHIGQLPYHMPHNPRMRTAGSVTSLSVGIQCNPDDAEIRTTSETCLIPVGSSTSLIGGSGHYGAPAITNHHQHQSHYHRGSSAHHSSAAHSQQPQHPSASIRLHHMSNPDFRHATSFDIMAAAAVAASSAAAAAAANSSSSSGHHHHHHHGQSRRGSERSGSVAHIPLALPPPSSSNKSSSDNRSRSDRDSGDYARLVQSSHHNHHHHHHQSRPYTSSHHGSGSSGDRSGYHSGSLGRRHQHNGGGGPIYGRLRELPSSNETWHRFSPTPPHSSSRGGSSVGGGRGDSTGTDNSRSTTTARRYGSIRVAECSFIEHNESRVPSPPSLVNCDDVSGSVGRRRSSLRQMNVNYSSPSVPSAFNPYASSASSGGGGGGISSSGGKGSLSSIVANNIDSSGVPPNRLPPPPSSPALKNRRSECCRSQNSIGAVTATQGSGGGRSGSPMRTGSHRGSSTGNPAPLCNGPTRGLRSNVSDDPLAGTYVQFHSSGNGTTSIIPPPTSFEDFQQQQKQQQQKQQQQKQQQQHRVSTAGSRW